MEKMINTYGTTQGGGLLSSFNFIIIFITSEAWCGYKEVSQFKINWLTQSYSLQKLHVVLQQTPFTFRIYPQSFYGTLTTEKVPDERFAAAVRKTYIEGIRLWEIWKQKTFYHWVTIFMCNSQSFPFFFLKYFSVPWFFVLFCFKLEVLVYILLGILLCHKKLFLI